MTNDEVVREFLLGRPARNRGLRSDGQKLVSLSPTAGEQTVAVRCLAPSTDGRTENVEVRVASSFVGETAARHARLTMRLGESLKVNAAAGTIGPERGEECSVENPSSGKA